MNTREEHRFEAVGASFLWCRFPRLFMESVTTESSKDEYRPSNILITGGAGFIGSHVVIYLVKNYPHYKIFNLDKVDYCSSLKNLESIQNAPNYRFIKGDILSLDLVSYILSSNNIDTIIHFAAQTHVEFTKTNILGTHVLLEASRVYKIKRFIHVSTDEVYGGSAVGMDAMETSLLEPTNPYSASKAGAEHLVRSYYKSFHLPIIITRGNNVFGPHQFPEKVIPKFITRLEQGLPCCVHGDGSHRRSFLFIDDVTAAFVVILHRGEVGEIYNIGTDFELSTAELAHHLGALYGVPPHLRIEWVPDRPFNDLRYSIDPSKLRRLGWEPQHSFHSSLLTTILFSVEWYRSHPDHWPSLTSSMESLYSCSLSPISSLPSTPEQEGIGTERNYHK